jgi:hypothetical protein
MDKNDFSCGARSVGWKWRRPKNLITLIGVLFLYVLLAIPLVATGVWRLLLKDCVEFVVKYGVFW